MSLLKSLKITASHLIGNKEKKKIKNTFKDRTIFEDDKIYKLNRTRERITFVSENGVPILFSVCDDIFIPTIQYAKMKVGSFKKTVFLDTGALKPIMGGADVMAPGIYKYKDMINETINENDVVFVVIENEIIGVGSALLKLNDIDKDKKGAAIEILHRIDDALYNTKV